MDQFLFKRLIQTLNYELVYNTSIQMALLESPEDTQQWLNDQNIELPIEEFGFEEPPISEPKYAFDEKELAVEDMNQINRSIFAEFNCDPGNYLLKANGNSNYVLFGHTDLDVIHEIYLHVPFENKRYIEQGYLLLRLFDDYTCICISMIQSIYLHEEITGKKVKRRLPNKVLYLTIYKRSSLARVPKEVLPVWKSLSATTFQVPKYLLIPLA